MTARRRAVVGVPGRLDELLGLRREARQPDRWQPYDLERSYRTYANVEAHASTIETFQSQLVPGLVQTESYARAVIAATLRPDSDVDREIEVRKERQAVLSGDRRPAVTMVIAEGVLRQQVGSPTVMVEQLQKLIGLSGRDGMSVRVLPFSSGAHPGMRRSAFVVLRVREEELDAVYIEGQSSSQFSSEQEEEAEYSAVFERLQGAATDDGEETRDLLQLIVQDHQKRRR